MTEMYIVAAAMAPYNNFVYSSSAIPAAEEEQIEQEMMNHEVDGDAGAPSESACGGSTISQSSSGVPDRTRSTRGG